MEVLGQVQPYKNPPAHMSDEEEDADKDQDGLSPVLLGLDWKGKYF